MTDGTVSSDGAALMLQLKRPRPADLASLMMAVGFEPSRFEQAIIELKNRGFVSVSGPPNQKASLGYDIDHVELTALGFMTAHHEL